MKPEELRDELGHQDAQELLRSAPLARLAYTGPDGFPRVIPIGFLWTGGHVVVCTAPISPKVSALAGRPQVALTIDTNDAKALLLRGVAEMETVAGVPDEYLAAAAKTMEPVQLSGFETQVRKMYKEMTRITITPQWARFYDFGAGRVPGFLLKLSQESAGA